MIITEENPNINISINKSEEIFGLVRHFVWTPRRIKSKFDGNVRDAFNGFELAGNVLNEVGIKRATGCGESHEDINLRALDVDSVNKPEVDDV